jgi:hypothetical protein
MLDCNNYSILKREKILSSVQSYEIRNSETGELLGIAQERICFFNKAMRWVISKHLLPTTFELRERPDDSLVFTLHKRAFFFQSRIEVHDAMDAIVGYFDSKSLNCWGGFRVYDQDGNFFAHVKGKCFGHNYSFAFENGSLILGQVLRTIGELRGIGSDETLSSDKFTLTVNPELNDQPLAKMLLLATTLVIDQMYKSG